MNKFLKSLLLIATTFSVIEPSIASAEDKLETAPTKYIEANGIKFSYRTLGPTSGAPLAFPQHFTGNMSVRLASR